MLLLVKLSKNNCSPKSEQNVNATTIANATTYSSVSREELFDLVVGDTMRQSAHKHLAVIRFLFNISLLGGQLRIAQLHVNLSKFAF